MIATMPESRFQAHSFSILMLASSFIQSIQFVCFHIIFYCLKYLLMFDTFLMYESGGCDILITGGATMLAVLAQPQFSAYSIFLQESFIDKSFSLKEHINRIRFSYFSFTIRVCVNIYLHHNVQGTRPDFWRGECCGWGHDGYTFSSTRLLHKCECSFN